jgi:hypothetical protein
MTIKITRTPEGPVDLTFDDVSAAVHRAKEILEPWTQQGDRVGFFLTNETTVHASVLDGQGEETDNCCVIEAPPQTIEAWSILGGNKTGTN